MFIKYLIAVFSISFSLIGFSSCLEKSFSDIHLNEIYAIAQRKLKAGRWKQAIKKLKYLENHSPFNQYRRVQLNLIYAYYKNSELILAKEVIDRFIKLNPDYHNIDYVIYMRGLTNMGLSNKKLYRFLNVYTYDYDPKYIHAAFNDFLELVYNYPHSKYVTDAIKRLIFLKNYLAEYEYSIADYYTHRGAWIAVVNRVEDMLHNYSDTQATRNGLYLMKYAYCQMQMFTQADKVERIIIANNNTKN